MHRESSLEVVRAQDSEPTSHTLAESANDPDCTSRVGEVLDEKYELLRKIGEGGMGEVYEARHRVLGRRFAIKLLHPELVRSQRMLRRFSREALSASRIENDHVVAIADCGHLPDGAPYYVMDFLRGQDLRSVLRQFGPLPIPRAARLLQQICRGLNAAHELGLVHRDLKPENIFVERRDDGRDCAKILDFGVVQTEGGNSTAQTGALVGTLRYMAPEQARGDARLDHRADLYALGAILYECLAGQVPHPGRNTEEVLFNIMTGSPVPLDQLRAGVEPDLQAIVQRALSREPERRFQSALEFADALSLHAGANVEHASHQRLRIPGSDDGTVSDLSHADSAAVRSAERMRKGWSSRWRGVAWVFIGLSCGALLHLVDRAWLARPTLVAKTTGTTSANLPSLDRSPVGSSFAIPAASSSPPTPLAISGASPMPLTFSSAATVKLSRAPAPQPRATHVAPKTSEPVRADEYSQNLDWKNPYAAHPQ